MQKPISLPLLLSKFSVNISASSFMERKFEREREIMTCGGTVLKKITEKHVKHRLFTAPILGLDFVLYPGPHVHCVL